MKTPQALLSVAVTLLLSLSAAAHASSLSVYCLTGGNYMQNGGTTQAVCDPANQPGNGTGERIEYSASRAAYGSLGDGGSAQIQNLSNYASGVEAESSFSDSFTVNSPAPSSGTLLMSVTIAGSFLTSGTGNFSTSVGGNLTAQGGTFLSGSTGGTDTIVLLDGSTQTLTFAIPFVDSQVATDFDLTLYDYASCSVTGLGSCLAQANYYDTALVTSYTIENSSGVPLQETATFASGTDYDAIPSDVAATPEPNSLVLLGSGLSAFLITIRNKRTRFGHISNS